MGLRGDCGCDRWKGIAIDRFAGLANPLVRFRHKGVKMDAPFAGLRYGVEEHVHQHGLAASDAAVNVEPARRWRFGFTPAAQYRFAMGRVRSEGVCELIEPPCAGALRRVWRQPTGCDLVVIRLQDATGHAELVP